MYEEYVYDLDGNMVAWSSYYHGSGEGSATRTIIECERIATEPPKPASLTDQVVTGLLAANQIIEQQKADLAAAKTLLTEQAPKVLFAEAVTASDDCILVRQMAKILDQNGYPTGEAGRRSSFVGGWFTMR